MKITLMIYHQPFFIISMAGKWYIESPLLPIETMICLPLNREFFSVSLPLTFLPPQDPASFIPIDLFGGVTMFSHFRPRVIP